MSRYQDIMRAYNLYSPFPWNSRRSRWLRFKIWLSYRAFRKEEQ